MKTLLFAFLALASFATAENVTFEWDHPAPETVTDYALYRVDGDLRTLVGKSNVLTITAQVEPGQTFGVTAINADGLESNLSATLTLSTRPLAPGKPRVVKLQSSNGKGKDKWADVATLDFNHAKPNKK